jgi:hypothetical protein
MRNDLNELEHHGLFVIPIKRMKFELEELNKMLESRLESLTKHICENDLNATAYKNTRGEVFRTIEASSALCSLLYQELIKQLEKSFCRIEESEEEKSERLNNRGA